VLFVAAIVGVPAPTPLPPKADEDFPCRWHACGCMNAEMCRTHCCCFKPAATAEAAHSCCHGGKDAADEPHADAAKTCDASGSKNDSGSQSIEWSFHPTLQSLTCKGQTLSWVTAGFIATPAGRLELSLPRPVATIALHIVSIPPSNCIEPSLAPPRPDAV